MFTNYSVILVGLVCMIGLYFIQKFLCQFQNKLIGIVLPLLFFILSFYISIPNFNKAFYIQFSYGAFVSSIILFVILLLFTMALSVEYWKSNRHS